MATKSVKKSPKPTAQKADAPGGAMKLPAATMQVGAGGELPVSVVVDTGDTTRCETW